ncbi:hypothetical protein SOASR014_42040 [Pectobacterium carotovorum subsp. carotovorum]|nr:hypothetical protein SOASR014_42040 [Pectobacterium carotovorum subsp. carotovorum]GLX46519.1 hypothetical protein Pcaca01_41870 [Pectobacterium carotovorum subsp. carotovorum]
MNINVNDLTIGQAKSIAAVFGNGSNNETPIGNQFIGQHVIIRTYSAGVWFGVLSEKSGNEVIVKNARRMWRWWAKESISLSAVAKFGIDQSKSKIAPSVESVWLEAIEIIPTTTESTKLIEGAADVEAE